MSTYLVAFVIGEYDYVESQSSDGVTVRVYTPVGKAEQGKFALEVRMLPEHFYIPTQQNSMVVVFTFCPHQSLIHYDYQVTGSLKLNILSLASCQK